MSLFSKVISWFGSAGGDVADAGLEAAETITDFSSASGAMPGGGLSRIAVSEARDYLSGLVAKIGDPTYQKASMSPLEFAENGIDLSAEQLSVLKDTAASFYQLMIILGIGGMVLSIMIGAVSIGLRGERARHEVITALLAKTVVIMCLLCFVSVFGMFGAVANEIASAIV